MIRSPVETVRAAQELHMSHTRRIPISHHDTVKLHFKTTRRGTSVAISAWEERFHLVIEMRQLESREGFTAAASPATAEEYC